MNDATAADVLVGDCAEVLRTLEPASVQCVVTSPPYWGLRDYGAEGQVGAEESPQQYIDRLVRVMREVRRVLRDDGTLWLNLGDTYAQAGVRLLRTSAPEHAPDCDLDTDCTCGAEEAEIRVEPKSLLGIPWRVALALQDDGWLLRQDNIWSKPNPMPERVSDRCTKAHEYIFMLAKSGRYFYDADPIREKPQSKTRGKTWDERKAMGFRGDTKHPTTDAIQAGLKIPSFAPNPKGKNKRSVWTVPFAPFKGAHFAVFPPALVEPCILAGSRPGDLILDPFCGAGTTGLVARRFDRRFLGIEINPEFAELARNRITNNQPLFRGKVA